MNPKKIALSAPQIHEVTDDLIDKFRTERDDEGVVVINDDIYKWTLESKYNSSLAHTAMCVWGRR